MILNDIDDMIPRKFWRSLPPTLGNLHFPRGAMAWPNGIHRHPTAPSPTAPPRSALARPLRSRPARWRRHPPALWPRPPRSALWFIPRIVSGLVHPSYKWTNPTYPIYNQGYNPLTKWDEPPSGELNHEKLGEKPEKSHEILELTMKFGS